MLPKRMAAKGDAAGVTIAICTVSIMAIAKGVGFILKSLAALKSTDIIIKATTPLLQKFVKMPANVIARTMKKNAL